MSPSPRSHRRSHFGVVENLSRENEAYAQTLPCTVARYLAGALFSKSSRAVKHPKKGLPFSLHPFAERLFQRVSYAATLFLATVLKINNLSTEWFIAQCPQKTAEGPQGWRSSCIECFSGEAGLAVTFHSFDYFGDFKGARVRVYCFYSLTTIKQPTIQSTGSVSRMGGWPETWEIVTLLERIPVGGLSLSLPLSIVNTCTICSGVRSAARWCRFEF